MKLPDIKPIIKELINEALFGVKVKVKFDDGIFPALISKNTKTGYGDEDEYRLTWFDHEDNMRPLGHFDFSESYKDQILQTRSIPMGLKIKLFQMGMGVPKLIDEMKRTSPRIPTGADILVGTIDPDDNSVVAKFGGSHAAGGQCWPRRNRQGDWRYNDLSRIVYWHESHPREYETIVNEYILNNLGEKVKNHVNLDEMRLGSPSAYEWFWNDAHGKEQSEDH